MATLIVIFNSKKNIMEEKMKTIYMNDDFIAYHLVMFDWMRNIMK